MYKLAIYGKGGIGKSTTTSNLAAALAARGHTVMQIGCDPKADSTRLHFGEAVCNDTAVGAAVNGGAAGATVASSAALAAVASSIVDADVSGAANVAAAVPSSVGFSAPAGLPTVLDCMREGGKPTLDQVVRRAPDGVLCVEAGGPVPGVGCAGRGIIAAFDLLEKLHAYEELQPDIVLYDVLGDVVCGGFAMPLRGQYADEVAIVTSGEMMSLYAASNIMRALENFKKRGYAQLLGLVANLRNVPDEQAKLQTFCEEEGARVIATVPRSSTVQDAEDEGRTVVAAFPDSDQAAVYGQLAELVERRAEAKAAGEGGIAAGASGAGAAAGAGAAGAAGAGAANVTRAATVGTEGSKSVAFNGFSAGKA